MRVSTNNSKDDLQSLSSTLTATAIACDNIRNETEKHSIEVARLQRGGDDAGTFEQVKNRRLHLTRRFSVACLDHPAAEAVVHEESVPLIADSEHGGYTKQIADRRRRLVKCLSAANLGLASKQSATSKLLSTSKSLILLQEELSSVSADESVAAKKNQLDTSITYLDNNSRHSILTASSFHSIAEVGEHSENFNGSSIISFSDSENEDSFAFCSNATLMTEQEQDELNGEIESDRVLLDNQFMEMAVDKGGAHETLPDLPKKTNKKTTKKIKPSKKKLNLPINTSRDGKDESMVQSCESSLMALITSDSRHSKKSTGSSKSKMSKRIGGKSTKSSKAAKTVLSLKGSSTSHRNKKSQGKSCKSSTKGLKQ